MLTNKRAVPVDHLVSTLSAISAVCAIAHDLFYLRMFFRKSLIDAVVHTINNRATFTVANAVHTVRALQ